jgi:3-hydroxy-9,10-secoandrosta-1,3,5(10)-triene-9,17-dione monooxygenase reductase component
VSIDSVQLSAHERPSVVISGERYRDVLGHFITGVTVVTGVRDEGPAGFTCQSFASLSLDPPLVLLCASKGSTSWPKVSASGRFAVNLLAHDQAALARRFAVSGGDKFEGIFWSVGRFSGAPILRETLGWLECEITRVHEAGDHWIVVSHVLDLAAHADRQPLTFFRGTLAGFDSHQPDRHPPGAGAVASRPGNNNEEGIESCQKQ